MTHKVYRETAMGALLVADPGWFQIVFAAVGGFFTAIVVAIAATWNLSSQMHKLKIEIVKLRLEINTDIQATRDLLSHEDRDTRHTLYGRIDTAYTKIEEKLEEETGKIEFGQQKIEERLRSVEHSIAAWSGIDRGTHR